MRYGRAKLSAVLTVITLLTMPTMESGQWLMHPTPGIPRTSDGKPDLSAPAPRTQDGKPDLSGLWRTGPKFESDFKPSDAQPWAQEQAKRHEANLGTDSWIVLCLPPGPMINFIPPLRIIQTPGIVAILYEVSNNYRQIFTDGRDLPQDPTPSWQGYSIGHWDGDTLVVETNGFNDKSMVGRPEYPHSEDLRITERYHRRDFGHIDLQMKVDDPKTFLRSWTINAELVFEPDTEMLEYVCNENEKDRQHFVLTQNPSDNEIHVDAAVLSKYVGTYEATAPNGQMITVSVKLDSDQLTIDVPGGASGPLVAESSTLFLFRRPAVFSEVKFVLNEQGEVTHLVFISIGGERTARRTGPPR